MPNKLCELKIHEVSFVDRPACAEKGVPRARIAIFKRDNSNMELSEVLKATKGIKFVIGFPSDGSGSEVQSVIFDAKLWTEEQARKWLSDNDFKSGKIDKTEDSLRFRQADPEKYSRFRTVTPGQTKKRDDDKDQLPAFLQFIETGDKSNMPMTQEQTEKMLEGINKNLETLVTKVNTLETNNQLLQTENELVVKMSPQERQLYTQLTTDQRTQFVKGDGNVRKGLLETTRKSQEENALVETMDADLRKRFDTAGPIERQQILADVAKAAADAADDDSNMKDCPKCNGTGKIAGKKCKACDGEGEVAKGKKSEGKDAEDDDEDEAKKAAAEIENHPVVKQLQAEIARLRDDSVTKSSQLSQISKREKLEQFTKRAEDIAPNTPGSPETKGTALMKMAETFGEESEEYKNYVETQKAASAALSRSFSEVGRAAAGEIPTLKKFDNKVQEIMKRDKISLSKATGQAMSEHPDLYADYEAEQQRVALLRR